MVIHSPNIHSLAPQSLRNWHVINWSILLGVSVVRVLSSQHSWSNDVGHGCYQRSAGACHVVVSAGWNWREPDTAECCHWWRNHIHCHRHCWFVFNFSSVPCVVVMWLFTLYTVGWLRGTVVERRSLVGKLSLPHARLAADGWPLL